MVITMGIIKTIKRIFSRREKTINRWDTTPPPPKEMVQSKLDLKDDGQRSLEEWGE
mgnify:CR=1 FL=1|tara:strand:+ start:9805 stop:9972 length:168 start_codon:yes stop_codon:yes gene_type:complete